MTTKWNALALGLAATVIFSAGETQAQAPQSAFAMPAEISVTRDGANSFNFSSNPLQEAGVCGFTDPITILGAFGGEFPSLGEFGVIQLDGSLTVDRANLLATLDSMEATFALFCTDCGTNTSDFGAQALRAKIRRLEDGESATLHTLYFLFEACSGDV